MLPQGLQNFVYRHFCGKRAQGYGGYPPELVFLPGHVVVASVEDYRPSLTVYTNRQVKSWHKRSKELFKYSGLTWDDAVFEAEE